MGQTPPGLTPRRFGPPEVLANQRWFWHASPAFSPDRMQMYWAKYVPPASMRLAYSASTTGGWSLPAPPPFAGTGDENQPRFSADGNTLYYISETSSSHILRVDRSGTGWSQPQGLGLPLPSGMGLGWQFSLAADRSVYLDGDLGQGGSLDLFRFPRTGNGYGPPVPVPVNTPYREIAPWVAPDESFLVFSSDRPGGHGRHDLWVTFKRIDGSWTEPLNLGPDINTPEEDGSPTVTPDGLYLFYLTIRSGDNGYNPYWVSAQVIQTLRNQALDITPATVVPFERGPQQWPSWNTSQTALADLDGDGDLDAALAMMSYLPSRVLLNDGKGGFQDSGATLARGLHGVSVGDVDFYGGGGGGSLRMEEEVVGLPPLLILHGEEDPVVGVSFARALCDAALRAGGRVEMRLFPGCGHAFNLPWSPAYARDADEESFALVLAFLREAPRERTYLPQARAQAGASAFVEVNGVRLHYLDWGGDGETVLFLHGLGDEASRFEPLASRLRRDFRVLGLDWRGHGQSDAPARGYDTGTLVSDLAAFLDRLGIGKVHLVGHSLAGDQLTRFAGLFPDRVGKLVYLDAAFDRGDLPALFATHPTPPQEPTDPIVLQLQRGSEASHPDYSRVRAPALAYFVLPDQDSALRGSEGPEMRRRLREYVASHVWPYVNRNADRFRREVVRGCAVMMRDTNHYFFLDQPARFAGEIRGFLLDPGLPPSLPCLSSPYPGTSGR